MSKEECLRTLHRLRKIGSLKTIMTEKHKAETPKKIVIDYSSPNIAKQFHIGNLRSTLIGKYIDSINRLIGNNVTSINYLGDWGVQFAMIAAYWPHMKPSDQYWNSLSDVEKIKQLTDCYVVANKNMRNDEQFREDVHKFYCEMEELLLNGSMQSESLKLWSKLHELSKNHLSSFYKIFDIRFDRWMNESQHVVDAHKVVQDLVDRKIVNELEGRLTVPLDGSNNEYAIIRKSNNTSLYLTREIASILKRDEMFQADQYLFVVDRSQRQHFNSLKIILDKMGRSDLAEKVVHVQYGRVKGLSTRNGRTEVVGDIVERGSELALQFMKSSRTFCMDPSAELEISKVLSLSTIIFNELKRARNSEYEFSFQNAFALNQNNALSLQMKHSRLSSIETRNENLMAYIDNCNEFPDADNDDVQKMIRLLRELDESIELSYEKLEACQLTVQLIQIAQTVGKIQNQLRVKDQPQDVAVPRLLLFSVVRNVLAEGMKLLGMVPARSM